MRFQRILGKTLPVIAAIVMMFSVAEAKKPPAPTNTGSCPNTADLGTFQQASNVSASFSNSGNTTTNARPVLLATRSFD